MAAHVPFKKTDIASSLASIPCAVPGKYLLTALQAMAGGNLTYLRDNILYHKDELLQEADQPDIFKYLDQIAARVPAGSNGVLYTPWIWVSALLWMTKPSEPGCITCPSTIRGRTSFVPFWKELPSTRAGRSSLWKGSWVGKWNPSTWWVEGAVRCLVPDFC